MNFETLLVASVKAFNELVSQWKYYFVFYLA
jgi:hypothetical protein